MNTDSTTKKITETAVVIAIMVIFAFIGFYTFPIISILYPVPAIITGYRNGIKYSILSVIAASLLVGMVMDLLTGVFLLVLYGLLGISLTYLINKKYKPYEILIGGTITFLISILFTILIVQGVTGIGFVDEIKTLFNESLNLQYKVMEGMGLTNYELTKLEELFSTTTNYIISIVPAIIMITSVFTAYINYWITIAILRRMGKKIITMPQFKNFRLPNNIILGTAIIFLATLALKYINVFYYETIFKNVVVLVFFVFFIQGLAVITFLTDKTKLNKFIKGLIIFFIIIYVPMSLIVALMGLFDSIFNLRKINVK